MPARQRALVRAVKPNAPRTADGSSARDPSRLEALPEPSLLGFMWVQRRAFTGGLLYALARIVVISPLPLVFKAIIDTFLPARNVTGILAICAATVLILGLHHWLTLQGAERLGRAVTHLVLQMRALIFAKIQDLNFAYLDREKSGRLLSKYAFDTQKIDMVMMPLLNSFLPDAVYCVITLGILVTLSWKLALVVVVMLPLVALMRAQYFERLQNEHEVNRRAQEHLTGTATEFFGALRLLRSYGQEEHAHRRLERGTEEVAQSTVRMIGVMSSLGSFSFAAMRVLTLIVIAGGAILAIHGQITAGEVLAFVAGVPVLVQPIQLFAQLSKDYFLGQEAYRSIKELVEDPRTENWHGGRTIEPLRGGIEFDRVGFQYGGADQDALRDFSLRIVPGERIAFVGASGAGKSTVASLLLGLYRPQSGEILIDGVPQAELDMRWLRRNIAIVLQETILLSGTIAENLRFARPEATDAEVREAARRANADEFIARLPDGFDTVIGERGAMLSGGQRQRLAIARALLREPAILILDEPTSALDYRSEALIQEALDRLSAGRTVLTIAHRLSTIRNADRIVVLQDGRIVEEGAFDALVQRGGFFADLLAGETVG